MRRVGLYLQDKHPIPEEVRYAQYAERRGFDCIWHAESRLARDGITPVAAILARTKRLKAGPGVINTWTRNVALIAVTFSTLHEMSNGRALLGLGAWWDPIAWKVGIERRKPLQVMREYVEVLKRLFAMERVTYQGEFVRVRDIRLDIVYGDPDAPRRVPIYVGATGMRMMELTGEVADGVLLNYLVSPKYNAEALAHLKRGATRARRSFEKIDRPQLIVCSLDPDADKALDAARLLVTQYLGQQPHIMKASGVKPDLIDAVTNTMGGWPAKRGGIKRAMELVSDDVVQLLCAAGDAQACRRKVREYEASGCTCPLLYPLGDDVRLMIDEFAPI